MATTVRIVLVVLLFVALGMAATWPVWSDPLNISLVGVGQNDSQFLIWATFWGYHSLTTNPAGIHNTNIFHPERYTYLYSDAPLADSLLVAPWIAIFYHPEFTYSILILTMIALGGLGMFMLAYDLVKRSDAALLAALVYMFNPAHFGRLMQIHMFGDHWIPWFIWALLRWLRGYRKSDGGEAPRYGWLWAVLAAVFYILNVLSGAHIAVFGTLIGGAVGLYYMLRDRLFVEKRFWFGLGAMLLLAMLVLVPVFYPYIHIHEQMRQHRIDTDNALQVGSAGPYELLSANTRFYNWLDKTSGWPGDLFHQRLRGYLFFGIVPLIIAWIGLLRRPEKTVTPLRDWHDYAAWTLDIALIAAAWMAAVSAIAGNESFLLPFIRFSAPPSIVLILLALMLAAIRFMLFPGKQHALIILIGWLRKNVRPSTQQWPWMLLFLLGISLALGPSGFIYTVFAKLPLINLIRVPRRFILVSSFALAVLCAFGLTRLLKNSAKLSRYIPLALVFALFAFEAAPEPVRVYPVEKPHPLYQWLSKQEGDFAVMEFPTGPRAYGSFIRQVYGSIYHWKKLIVGYSGYQSEENIQLIRQLNANFPNDECIQLLKDLDVKYVMVQQDRLDDEKQTELAGQNSLKFVDTLGGVNIYEIIGATSE